MINEVTILWSNCGCGISYYNPENPITSPYVTYDSDKNVFSDNYKPYVTADDEDKFYVPYNYDADMAQEPVKLGEIDEIADINDVATILIIDVTGREYQATVEETALLLGGLMGFSDVVAGSLSDGDTTYDNVWFGGRVVQEITTDGQTFILASDGTTVTGDFTQSGNSITWVNGNTWYIGQRFRAKI